MQDGGTEERFILVVDGNADHVDAIQRALNGGEGKYRLDAIANGQTALDFLHRREGFSNAPRPDLILLDLNLPGQDGHTVLTDIKADPHLKRIPIIIFTVSDREEDIFRSYAEQGNCYVIKASDTEQLCQTVKKIEDFWLEIVTLPLE